MNSARNIPAQAWFSLTGSTLQSIETFQIEHL